MAGRTSRIGNALRGPAKSTEKGIQRAENKVVQGGVLAGEGLKNLASSGADLLSSAASHAVRFEAPVAAPITAAFNWLFPPSSPTAGLSRLQIAEERRAAARVGPQVPPTPRAGTPGRAPTPAGAGGTTAKGQAAAGGPAAPGGATATGPTSPAGTPATIPTESIPQAVAMMQSTYGVPASIASQMAPWYLAQEANGLTTDQMQNSMYTQPWFKQAFPGIVAAIANGLSNVPTPLAYSQDYGKVGEFTSALGMGPNAVSSELYGSLVAKGLTSAEIKNNIGNVYSSAASANPQVTALLSRWYGVPNNPGAIATLLVDPNGALARENGQAGIMPSAQLTAEVGNAAVGGAQAELSGFNKLSKADLLGIAKGGATAQEIGNAASGLVGALGTTQATSTAGGMPTATQAELLAGTGGQGIPQTQEATLATERAIGGRTAAFKGGGGAAVGTPGTPGGTGYGTQ